MGNQMNLRCNQGRRAGPPVGEVWGGGGVPGFEPRCPQGERQGVRVTARGPPAEASWGPGAEAPSLLEHKPVAEDVQETCKQNSRDSGREARRGRALLGPPWRSRRETPCFCCRVRRFHPPVEDLRSSRDVAKKRR